MRKLSAVLLTGLLSFAPFSALAETETAIFAGGCFWCIESDFEKVEGVKSAVSGYIGGTTDNPTYKSHSADGHIEAVEITYDPAVVSYESLLDTFWRTVDPTDAGGQFCDRGNSYTTAVFALNEQQAASAEKSKEQAQAALGRNIVTPVRDATRFWPAEEYHQDYYKKSSTRYKYYRWACGRDQRVKELWGPEAYKGVSGYKSS